MDVDPKILEERNALEAAIIDQYDNEEDRQTARELLSEATGINFDAAAKQEDVDAALKGTGDEGGAPESSGKQDLSQDANVGNQPVQEAGKDGGEGGKETGAGADDKGKDGDEGGDDDAAAKLQAELDAKNARIEELERKEALAAAENRAAEEIAGKVSEKRAEAERLNAADDEKAKEFEDTYGEEAAADYRKSIELNKKARLAEVDQFEKDETASAKAAAESTLTEAQQNQRDLEATPELKQWQDDAIAAYKGDESKSDTNYKMAQAIDSVLREDAEWKDKPQTERFEEVVKRVKASDGASSSGSPNAQDKSTEKTDQQIADELAAKAARDQKGTGIQSIGDITGGESGNTLEERLQNMEAADVADMLASGQLTTEQVDKVIQRIQPDD